MTQRIPAIETRYAGVLFRSRLEARYAVLMDALGIKWEYEPERIALPGGGTYLPDFLTDGKVYVEVKGAEENLDKPYLLRAAAVLGYLSVLGPIPECRRSTPVRTVLVDTVGNGDVSDIRMMHAWADYRPAGEQLPEELVETTGHIEAVDTAKWLDPPRMNARKCSGNCPYDAARSARFEHGQEGAVG